MCFENLLFEATTNLKNYNDFKNKTKNILNNFTLDEAKFRAFKKRNKDIIKNYVNEYNYSKIKLFENSTFDIYVIFWFENSESPYHDHAEHGCFYKVLNGNLSENILKNENKNENEIESKILSKNNISYIDNYIGYHKIKNAERHIITDKDKVELFLDASVSIHFYSPPNYKANLL